MRYPKSDTLKVMYENEKNPSRVFEIYELLFELKQKENFIPKFYEELKSLIDELEMNQRVVTDVAILREHRQDLVVSKFLSGLSLTTIPVAESILRGDSILTLTATSFKDTHFYWR